MSGIVRVEHKGGDVFELDVRGHRLHVDQPIEAGGSDVAPTPTELLVASLAACVAHYARRYLARHDVAADGLTVSATFTMAERPARVASIDVVVDLDAELAPERRAALLAVARGCTVHHTLAQPPAVSVELAA